MNVFRTYGGSLHQAKWLELFLGVSPAHDYTLFIGVMGILLAGLGTISLARKHRHLLLLILLLWLIGIATPVATWFYYTWPMMKYYRHLGLTACFIKLFLCFLAGFGFEKMFLSVRESRRTERGPRWVVPLLALLIFLALKDLARHPSSAAELLLRMFGNNWGCMQQVLEEGFLARQLERTSLAALGTALLAGGRLLIPEPKFRGLLLCGALALQSFDLYSYKTADAFQKTVALTEIQKPLTQFQEMPFARRRESLDSTSNPRVRQLLSLPLYWATYWSTQSFLFLDEPGSSFRIDHWQRPLDDFLRAYWGQPLGEFKSYPRGLVRVEKLVFPAEHPAARKIAGLTEDKIQFFSKVTYVNSEQAAADQITDPAYSGDYLVLTRAGQSPLPGKGRLHLPYRVERFDSNHLEVTTEIPGPEPVWMLYSDVWHPGWKGRVNGQPALLSRANLAYKAVLLNPGHNRVEFEFHLGLLPGLQRCFAIQAFLWLLALAGLAGKTFWEEKPG